MSKFTSLVPSPLYRFHCVCSRITHVPTAVLRALRLINQGRGATEPEVQEFVKANMTANTYDRNKVVEFLKSGVGGGTILMWPNGLNFLYALNSEENEFWQFEGACNWAL